MSTTTATLDAARLCKAFFTDPAFRGAMADRVWEAAMALDAGSVAK